MARENLKGNAATMTVLIDAQSLVKVYGAQTGVSVHALAGVDIQVQEGEFVGIAGPSGSGKSTLLNVLGCLDRPTSGRYLLDGLDVAVLSDRELSRIRSSTVGFVFQSFNLLPRLSVLENIGLPLAYAGVARRERRRRAEELADRLGLADRASHRPSELSGGQAQRVGIARALASSPRAVFADEPTGNVDSKTAEGILELLVELHRDGMTIVLVSHDERIVSAADRAVHIIDGQVATDGTPGRLRQEHDTGEPTG